jgi:phosphonate transport system substrate-binding protein
MSNPNLPDLPRRSFLLATTSLASQPLRLAAADEPAALRIGLTPVFLDSRSGFLERWRRYLELALGQSVVFVQRRSYADILELLLNGQLNAAWLCGYPYVRYKASLKLIVVPRYRGAPLYSAYIITGPSAKKVNRFSELRGKVFAYSDPLSNSGFLFAKDQLHALGEQDTRFFRKTFFAFGHQNVISAVSEGLADAGSVDGYVWDSLQRIKPDLTQNTHILAQSSKFGFPPFVAPASRSHKEIIAFRKALLGMQFSSDGKELLRELNLDGFESGHPSLFRSIEEMMNRLRV